MENKSNAFLAGVFTIGLAILVSVSLFWFSSDHAVRVPYDLITRSTVNGLGPQADVKYRGLEVGKVVSIKFDPQVPGQIIVRISVNHDTPITRTTYATLGFQGVTGIAYVQLDDSERRRATRQLAAADDVGTRARAHRDAARFLRGTGKARRFTADAGRNTDGIARQHVPARQPRRVDGGHPPCTRPPTTTRI
jgi:phospholipid/cholesterol/gamma-HCH transport system substrate-binding protein